MQLILFRREPLPQGFITLIRRPAGNRRIHPIIAGPQRCKFPCASLLTTKKGHVEITSTTVFLLSRRQILRSVHGISHLAITFSPNCVHRSQTGLQRRFRFVPRVTPPVAKIIKFVVGEMLVISLSIPGRRQLRALPAEGRIPGRT